MHHVDEDERRRRKAAERERNAKLMPNLTALVADARKELQAQGFNTKTMKLIYGRDLDTGLEIGSPGALEVQAGDLAPRRVR